MTLTLRTDYGCTEAVISENCGFDKFYNVADLLAEQLRIRFTNKIDDSDTSYWDFIFKGQKLTLHYNIYDGVSIFPRSWKEAVRKDNEAVQELAKILEGIR
ncbi:MAG: DUF3630 family protein [Chitinophagaceae bacterium]|jgi:hypothetical protein|nr:DUF3630 family protein [Chitinophagaceae bacterium]